MGRDHDVTGHEVGNRLGTLRLVLWCSPSGRGEERGGR